VQQEGNIWYVSSPSLAVYPCAYRLFKVTPEAITIETYHVSFPALIKKAKNAFTSCALAYKYSSKPATFALLAEGSRLDSEVSLPLVPGKPIQTIEKKKQAKPKKERPKKVRQDSKKESKPAPKPETESDVKLETAPETPLKSVPEKVPEVKVEPQAEPKIVPKPDTKPEIRPTPKVEAKTEVKTAAPSSGESNDK
jgi:hypothetical protein